MKSKKVIFSLLSIISIALLPVAFFTNLWQLMVEAEPVDGEAYKLLDKFSDDLVTAFKFVEVEFASIWSTLLSIFAVIALVAGVLFIVSTILEMLKTKTKIDLNKSKRLLSFIMLICFVAIMVFGFIFTLVNTGTFTIFTVSSTLSMNAEIGYFILLGATLLASIFGLIATCGKKKSKKG